MMVAVRQDKRKQDHPRILEGVNLQLVDKIRLRLLIRLFSVSYLPEVCQTATVQM